jgi:hypothetical protein
MIRKLIPGIFSALFFLSGCGSNQPISVSPASADAQNFPNGIVQFTALGVSSPTWCIGGSDGRCNGNIVAVASIDSSGRAQCNPGRNGTVTVLAGVGGRVMNPDGGMQFSRFASAQLTCP